MNLKRTILALTLIGTIGLTNAKAQTIRLPEVKHTKADLYEIDNFVPTKDFLAKNPDFLKDGSYQLNSSLIPEFNASRTQRKLVTIFTRQIGTKSVLGTLEPAFAKTVNEDSILNLSSTYAPSIKLPVNNKLALLNDAVQFQIYLNKYYSSQKELHTFDVLKEDILKVSSAYGITDFDLLDNNHEGIPTRPVYKRPDELVLSLFMIKIAPMEPDFFGPSYPSYAIYQLTVRDINGGLLKSYRQAIFFSCKYRFSSVKDQDWVTDNLTKAKAGLSRDLYLTALHSVLGQMANDDAFIATLTAHSQLMQQNMQQNPEMVSYLNAKILLLTFQGRKSFALSQIQGVNIDLSSLNANLIDVGQINLSSFSDPNKNANAAVNSIGNIAAAGIDAIRISAQNAKIKNLTQQGEQYVANYKHIQLQEDSLIKAQTPAVVKMLANDNLFQRDQSLAATFAETQNNLGQASAGATAKLNGSEESFRKQLNDAFAKPETLAATAGNFPGGAGLGGAGGSASLSECSKQTADDWTKNDPAYLSFMRSHNVSEGELAKASLIDKTLQSCSSMMTPTQITDLKKASAECKATAYQMQHNGYSLGTNGFTKLGN